MLTSWQDRLELNDVRLSPQMRASSVVLSGGSGRYSLDPLALEVDETSSFELWVTADDLRTMVTQSLPPQISRLDLTLGDGVILIDAAIRLFFEMSGRVTCRIRIEDGKKLFVEVLETTIPATNVGMLQGMIQQINPVFDAGRQGVPLVLEHVEITPRAVRVSGQALPGRVS